ncbi:acetamidase/formamidase family protein [Oceanobacillus alkalisoli]|uniref:acetamidase/formamidase family protein n=1 Tax=Oceanobacillus alkalisoli TaxID=2925113 RepID=UPI001EF0ED6B|nr:acetamidase/formamidase family protein [Oceanobacillus alkalisoli]MCF3942109.1 acetamidase/formamidase family protein [Oceanobacillus alkalisoli]MCG5105026.1 acetamidase/formamidase family protein [Oceanobacillus alkalisoli]
MAEVITKLTKDSGIIYEFNKENVPTKKVASGTTLTIETYDCFEDQIQSEDTVIGRIDWNRINPATGPVFVENAKPGDILKVKIEKIDVKDQGVMAVVPELGVMGESIEKMEARIMQIKDDKVRFNGVEAPVNKMIGVIGVAPEGEGVNSGTPGAHGGNMDNTMVKEGATLYFPVSADGALFALGDLHAAMGDGEVSGTGVEIAGEVTVRLDVIKSDKLEQPMLENDEVFTQIATGQTFDEAANLATALMTRRIAEKSGRSLSEVTMLVSMNAQLEVCQVVNPLKTARFVVPKWLLKQLEIDLIKK